MTNTDKKELSAVLKALRDVLATNTLRPCLERTNAVYYLKKHKDLLKS